MDLTLKIWPNITNALSISAECDFAIAADESVEILIPKIKPCTTGDHQQSQQVWDILHITTNVFNDDEVPLHQPFPNPIASLGEEQSTGHIVSLAWSNPGLSKYQRCALAILTSNHVLSIWISTGQPRQMKSWSRAAVVNHAVRAHYAAKLADDRLEAKVTQESEVQAQRIRAFAWGPCISGFTTHLLAVATEAGDIIVLGVNSSYASSLIDRGRVEVEVLSVLNIGKLASPRHSLSSTLEDYIRGRCHAHLISWSPSYRNKDGNTVSALAFATMEGLEVRPVTVQAADLETLLIGNCLLKESIDPFVENLTGPMKWYPKIFTDEDKEEFLLAIASSHRVDMYSVNFTDTPTASARGTFEREQWDEVSALAFTCPTSTSPLVNISNHISTSTSTDALKDLFMISVGDGGDTPWQQKIARNAASFSAQYKLGGNVISRVEGMATSLLGDFVATLSTQHPSDMPEYRIPSEYLCQVNISGLHAHPDEQFSLPINGGLNRPEDITAEVISFSARHWLLESKTSTAKYSSAQSSQDLMDSVKACVSGDSLQRIQDVTTLREWLELSDTRVRRAHNLMHMQIRGSTADNEYSNQCIMDLVEAALQYASQLTVNDDLSRKIISAYQAAIPRLEQKQQQMKVDRVEATYIEMPTSFEQCEICDAPIMFQDLSIARCDIGHETVRCALTFLAVQAPGISKFCGICGRQFLNDRFLHDREARQTNGDTAMTDANKLDDSKQTFAQMLADAVVCCIYCGGKFVD